MDFFFVENADKKFEWPESYLRYLRVYTQTDFVNQNILKNKMKLEK